MAGAVTETTNNELCHAINALVAQYRYFSLHEKEIAILLDTATKLIPVEPAWGNMRKGSIFLLSCEFEKGLHHIKVANHKLPGSNSEALKYNSAVAVSNHNFYTESHKYLSQINTVTEHEPFAIMNVGYNCLAFNKLKELIMDAQKYKMAIDENSAEVALRAAAVLESAGLSDALVAKYADVVGEVLRENQYLVTGSHPVIEVGDDQNNWFPHTVFIKFVINSDPKTAANLYKSSIQRIIKTFGGYPDALHISIEAA